MTTLNLCDLHGAVVDFVTPACALHGFTGVSTRYAIWDTLGVTQAEFWAPIDAAGAQFWADLPVYPWAHELLDLLAAGGAEVRIYTKPRATAACLAGTYELLEREFGAPFEDFVMSPKKEEDPTPGRLLVDDCDVIRDRWTARGGRCVLMPQPWNAAREHVGRRMEYVREQLKKTNEE